MTQLSDHGMPWKPPPDPTVKVLQPIREPIPVQAALAPNLIAGGGFIVKFLTLSVGTGLECIRRGEWRAAA